MTGLLVWAVLACKFNANLSVILQIGVFADLLFAYQSNAQDSIVHCKKSTRRLVNEVIPLDCVLDNPEFDNKNKKRETAFFAVVMPGSTTPRLKKHNGYLILLSLSLSSLFGR